MKNLSMITSLVASVALLIMAAFVIIKGWRRQVNRYFFFCSVSALGILFTMFLTYWTPDAGSLSMINRVTQAFTMMLFSSLFVFSFIFPEGEGDFPFYKSIIMLSPAIVISLLVVYTDISISAAYFEGDMLVRDFKPFYAFYAAVALLYLLAAGFRFLYTYVKTEVEIHRLQLRYLFIGGSISIILAAVCSIILPGLFDYSLLYVLGPSVASFVMTFFLFYSVISYNLMDISTVIHRTVMYSVISMLIFIPVYIIIRGKAGDAPVLGFLSYEVLTISVVGVFVLFSVTVQPVIDSLFQRKRYEFENIVDRFILEMQELKDIYEIIERTTNLLSSSLGLRGSAFYLFDAEERDYLLSVREGADFSLIPDRIERTHPLVNLFLRRRGLITLDRLYVDEELPAEIRSDLPVFFNEYSIRIAIPVYHDRRLIGIICLGVKESAAGFTPSEISKLEYFQNRSSVFISAAVAYKQAADEQLVSRTVELSSNILSASIPVAVPSLEKIKFGAFIVPKYEKGSDYFDFMIREREGVGLVCADVSGVGINSSFYNVMLRSGFRASADDYNYTSVLMQNLNRLLFQYSEGKGELVTAFYLYIDLNTNRLYYTNAGYPGMELFRIEKNNFDTLDTEGIPLGCQEKVNYGSGRTNVVKGDIGLVYSKSLLNSENRDGQTLALPEIRGVIAENRTKSATEIANMIGKRYGDLMGISVPESDIVVIVFKV